MDPTLLQMIANHYVTLYLTPQEGRVLDTKTIATLGNDLESLLGHHLLPKNETTLGDEHHSETIDTTSLPGSPILSNLINYASLYRYAEQQCKQLGKSTNPVTRLRHLQFALIDRKINTYGDLILCGQNRSWLRPGNIRDPFSIPNLGTASLKLFYSFLNQQGIEIFNTPYRNEELALTNW